MTINLPKPPDKYDTNDQQAIRAAIAQADRANQKRNTRIDMGRAPFTIQSPNGTIWNVQVADDGTLSTNGYSGGGGGAAPIPALTHNHVFVGNSAGNAGDVPLSGDGTINDSGALTITESNGVPFGTAAFASTSAFDAAGAAAARVAKAGDTMTGPLLTQDGIVSAPPVSFASEPGTGFWRVSAGNVGLSILGVDGFQFGLNNSGAPSLGIGNALTPTLMSGRAIAVVNSGTSSNFAALGEGTVNFTFMDFVTSAAGPNLSFQKARGTIAAPAVPALNDQIGRIQFGGITNLVSPFGGTIGIRITGTIIETGTVGPSAMGSQLVFSCCPIGSATLSEVMRLEAGTGLSMFGANPVIDQNRAHRLRSTTIAAAIAPSVAGNLFYHSDAQGGAGEIAVDTATAYRHAGQAAVKKLTTDADLTYTPRLDGRIVRDTATLTVDRKLTLLITNVTDGHKVEVSRRGSAGGHNRAVYQANGTTLIVNLADNTSADFIYDAVAALWFQK